MISGGIKFFSKSQCLEVDGATASSTPSTGTATANRVLDRNPFTHWYTVGSDDLTTEYLTVDFGESKTINRLFLIDHNFKQFTVQYDVAGVWTNFAAVAGMDASGASLISETVFADTSAYYEFTSVATQLIRIGVTKTQVANAQKYLNQCVVTLELGTLAGYPTVREVVIDRNAKIKETISGRFSVQKGDETAAFGLSFKNYPSPVAYNVDIDLMMTLHDLDDPFLVWLCGGRRGTTYFKYILRGFRLRDLYQMQMTKALNLSYTQNVYKNPLNCEVQFNETI